MLRVLVALALVVWAGCGARPAPCPPVPEVTPGPPLLWRVQRGAGPIVWLYGTIHDAGIDAVPGPALDALAGARRFVSELGDAEPDPERMRELVRIQAGPGIDTQLGDAWWDLRDALRDVIREDDLRRARPWYALVLLNRQAAGKVEAMDGALAKRARSLSLPVDGLEKPEDQVAALDAVVTVADVRDALRTRKALRCAFVDLVAAYRAADLTVLEPMLVLPRTAEPLLYARNRRWLPALERYLAGDGAFVAVGLGHLLGAHGLPALLAQAGYTVERAR